MENKPLEKIQAGPFLDLRHSMIMTLPCRAAIPSLYM